MIAGLRRPGETKATTRRRCGQEFRAAGRLFSSEAGMLGFGPQASAAHLARMDAALADLDRSRSAG